MTEDKDCPGLLAKEVERRTEAVDPDLVRTDRGLEENPCGSSPFMGGEPGLTSGGEVENTWRGEGDPVISRVASECE